VKHAHRCEVIFDTLGRKWHHCPECDSYKAIYREHGNRRACLDCWQDHTPVRRRSVESSVSIQRARPTLRELVRRVCGPRAARVEPAPPMAAQWAEHGIVAHECKRAVVLALGYLPGIVEPERTVRP
jgi:hypothetical protein